MRAGTRAVMSVLLAWFCASVAHSRPSLESDRVWVAVDDDGRAIVTRELRFAERPVRQNERLEPWVFDVGDETWFAKADVVEARSLDRSGSQKVRVVRETVSDSVRTRIIFPSSIGETLRWVKIRSRIESASSPGEFSWVEDLRGRDVGEFRFEIRSRRPLQFWMVGNDALAAETEMSDGEFTLRFVSRVPFRGIGPAESAVGFAPDRALGFGVSTESDWSTYASASIRAVEARLADPLPSAWNRLRDLGFAARGDDRAKVDAVTAGLADLSPGCRPARGSPANETLRSLATLAEVDVVSCPERALILAAVLRSLGYKAQLAWIWRDLQPPSETSYGFPADALFNHVIVRVELGGRPVWIDPAQNVSFAAGIFADVAARPAFVLEMSHPRLERTAPLDAADQHRESHVVYERRSTGDWRAAGVARLEGRAAIGVTANNLLVPPSRGDRELVAHLVGDPGVKDPFVVPYDRGSSIVDDLILVFAFTPLALGSAEGNEITMRLPRVSLAVLISSDHHGRVADLALGVPSLTRSSLEIRDVELVRREPIECDLVSPWARLRRSIVETARGVRVEDEVELRVSYVRADELSESVFSEFQTRVRACFGRSALHLRSH